MWACSFLIPFVCLLLSEANFIFYVILLGFIVDLINTGDSIHLGCP